MNQYLITYVMVSLEERQARKEEEGEERLRRKWGREGFCVCSEPL